MELIGLELVFEAMKKVRLIWEMSQLLKVNKSLIQMRGAGKLEFDTNDWVYLIISPKDLVRKESLVPNMQNHVKV